jgi:hypothetical protein
MNKQVMEILERMSTSELRDHVILGGKILDMRVDRAVTAILESSVKVFAKKALIRPVKGGAPQISLQALPVSLDEYLRYLKSIEPILSQLHNAQCLSLGPCPGTDSFEVRHTFTVVPKPYHFLTHMDDETVEVSEVLSLHNDPDLVTNE